MIFEIYEVIRHLIGKKPNNLIISIKIFVRNKVMSPLVSYTSLNITVFASLQLCYIALSPEGYVTILSYVISIFGIIIEIIVTYIFIIPGKRVAEA